MLGVLVLSLDQLGNNEGTSAKLPGALLCLGLVLGGYLLTYAYRSGALHAVGFAATLLALPPFFFFLLFDSDAVPPVPIATILALTAAVWLASYGLAPSRGHSLYLGAGLIAAWLWAMEASENVFTGPIEALTSFSHFEFDDSSFEVPRTPDLSTLAAISLIFALVTLVAAVVGDRRDRRGMATPLLFVGVVTLASGIAFLADELNESGTGCAAILAGLAVIIIGATAGRRLTTWVGGGGVAIGAVLLVDTFAGDSPRGAGLSLVIAGLVVVLVAHIVSTSWKEPPETTPGPSTLNYRGGSTQPAVPPPPPAGSVLG